MKKQGAILFLMLSLCTANAQNKEMESINTTLNNWHNAAANVNFKAYFEVLSDDAVYMGTDATEYWNKKQFEAFAKPYFDKGKAWNFKALERNVYFSANKKIAWFDELLQTQMKICRGSGVMVHTKNGWKIKQYVLSMTIPNENTNEVIKIKSNLENTIIEKLNSK